MPKESTIVTIELKASGIAATARATAKRKESPILPPRNTFMPNTSAQTARIRIASFWPKLSRLTWSGVFFSDVVFRREAILPTSVSMPMAVTIKEPRP